MVGSLGVIALTTGTPVRITANQTDPTARIGAQTVRIQALPANAAVVWVGLTGMEGSPAGDQLLGVIGKPTAATGPSFDTFEVGNGQNPNTINLADIYLQGATSDGVIVSYVAN